MAKKAKASRALCRIDDKAPQQSGTATNRFFRRLTKDPAATLDKRDKLSVTASNLKKLNRMSSKTPQKRISPIELEATNDREGTTAIAHPEKQRLGSPGLEA